MLLSVLVFGFLKNWIHNLSENLKCNVELPVSKCFSLLYIYFFHSVCNKLGSGKLFSWGSNSDGQLGVGDTADRLAPTRVMGIQHDVVQLSAGCVSSAALTGNVLFLSHSVLLSCS
jgi:alpha-tubulin suppressor-like RCC1 family protein